MVEKRKNIHNFHADKKIPSTNTGEL
jgi:hypothetical protein